MSILQFDGAKGYIEIPDDIGFSVAATGTFNGRGVDATRCAHFSKF
jgi:hypothetical protein